MKILRSIKQQVITIVLLSGTCILPSKVSTMESAYMEALGNLITLHQQYQYPIVLSNQNALISEVYNKIITPYSILISNSVQETRAKILVHQDTKTDITNLIALYNTNYAAVMKAVQLFPQANQNDAWSLYAQALEGFAAWILQYMQQLNTQTVLSSDSILDAFALYKIGWALITPQTVLLCYKTNVSVKSAYNNAILSLLQNGINQQLAAVPQSDDPSSIYSIIAQYYTAMATIYGNAGMMDEQTQANANATAAQSRVTAYQKAQTFMTQGATFLSQGRASFAINFDPATASQGQISASINALNSALSAYQSALAVYTTLSDTIQIDVCNTLLSQLQSDMFMRGVQLLWCLFRNQSASSSSVMMYQTLDDFCSMNTQQVLQSMLEALGNKQLITVTTESLEELQEAFSALIQVLSTVPNSLNSQLAVIPTLQKALASSSSLSEQANQNKTLVDSFISSHDIVTLITASQQLLTIVTILEEIIAGSITLSDPLVMEQLIVAAQTLDVAYTAQNSVVPNFIFYFPPLNNQPSYVSWVMVLLCQITTARLNQLMSSWSGLNQSIWSVSEADQNQLITLLADCMSLQKYGSTLLSFEIALLQKLVALIIQHSSMVTVMQAGYNQAQAFTSADWIASQSGQNNMYNSSAQQTWQGLLAMNELLIQASQLSYVSLPSGVTTSSLQKTYVTMLQTYIQQAISNTKQSVFGYQLYVLDPLYKLSIANSALGLSNTFVINTLTLLCNGTSGLIPMLNVLQQNLVTLYNVNFNIQNVSQSVADAYAQSSTLYTLMQLFLNQQTTTQSYIPSLFSTTMKKPQLLVQQEALQASDISAFGVPSSLLSSAQNYVYPITVMIGSQSYTGTVIDPVWLRIVQMQNDITETIQQATIAEQKGDFASAANNYNSVRSLAISLDGLLTDPVSLQQLKQVYFQANTRYVALSLAQSVQGNNPTDWTVALSNKTSITLPSIPQSYILNSYTLPSITDTTFGSALPTSLSSANGILSGSQLSDALAVIQAYFVAQALASRGLEFTQCFQDYTLQPISGLAQELLNQLTAVKSSISSYVQQFTNASISATQNTDGSLSLTITNMPIPAIAPLFGGAPTAGIYYNCAGQLLAKGTQLINFNGSSYVPGQDPIGSAAMYQNFADAYMVNAKNALQTIQQPMATLQLSNKNFSTQHSIVNNGFLEAQAALYAPQASAYYYAQLSQNQTLANTIQSMYVDLYNQQITLYQKLMSNTSIDPTSKTYTTLVSGVNQLYVNWSAELDTNNPQIQTNALAIAQLFLNVASKCAHYTYKDSFSGMSIHHYESAAANIFAAKKQYDALKDTVSAQKVYVQALLYQLQAVIQKLNMYFTMQKNGITYTPSTTEEVGWNSQGATTQNPVQISYDQLLNDYENQTNETMNNGELYAYNTVQNLLLDGALYAQYLSNSFGALVTPVKSTDSSNPAGSAGNNGSKNNPVLDADLISYLQTNGVIQSGNQDITYTKSGTLASMVNLAPQLYIKFQNNYTVLSDWCIALYTAIVYQYINDYEGGFSSSNFSNQMQQFLLAMKKEASQLQNPASAYVG